MTTISTNGFNVESLPLKHSTPVVWDVGGGDRIGPLFRHYYPQMHAIVYAVNTDKKQYLFERSDDDRVGANHNRADFLTHNALSDPVNKQVGVGAFGLVARAVGC